MTPEQARLELDATTLRPQDASGEALSVVEQDAQLGAWVAERAEFDERVANAFDDLPVPGDLHQKLLALGPARVPAPRKVMPRAVMWVAMAALVLLLGAGWFWQDAKSRGWQGEALAKVQMVQYGALRLEHRSKQLDELKKLLAQEGSLSPAHLPATLATLNTYGCRTIEVAGKPATIVCFELAPGKEAHLVVMNASDLNRPPPQATPEFNQQGGWATAMWSDGPQSFLLATNEDPALLKKLFGLAMVRMPTLPVA